MVNPSITKEIDLPDIKDEASEYQRTTRGGVSNEPEYATLAVGPESVFLVFSRHKSL